MAARARAGSIGDPASAHRLRPTRQRPCQGQLLSEAFLSSDRQAALKPAGGGRAARLRSRSRTTSSSVSSICRFVLPAGWRCSVRSPVLKRIRGGYHRGLGVAGPRRRLLASSVGAGCSFALITSLFVGGVTGNVLTAVTAAAIAAAYASVWWPLHRTRCALPVATNDRKPSP